MGKIELPKNYDPHEAEKRWTGVWEEKQYFAADPLSKKPRFSIVIPPPNVTNVLHLGHALNNTMQDVLVRQKRMAGYEAEWLPGTDHAGIATQVVVEKQLKSEGLDRRKLGREKFIERVWAWKEKHGGEILQQLRDMGCSCDWSRTRFTMDEMLSRAVREVFVRLYAKGLIYRGTYIINWCPRCRTTLSDDELERKEEQSSLWYIKYPLADGGHLTVATTRPETMLGDTALAVSPKDKRYKAYVGKTAILPLLNRKIPIIADTYIDPEFGTGVLKVTPAHDPNDYLLGKKHGLEEINIMAPDARINENGGKYKGLERFEARKRVVEDLEKAGLLEKIEPYDLAAGRCYRCHTVIEPLLSEQWFVKMKELAGPAIEAVRSGRIRFHPEHWSRVYLHWMENIRDWCISRQLWWGHRIPVYIHKKTGEVVVSATPPGDGEYRQDEDVLDTWFSSWLWPFSTFGWPEQTPELKAFYPTAALFTASEIIYLWVARMVMAGCEFMGEIPFSDVYIHGTVRDAKGIRMSKSLGNGIDPRDIIKEYGADALRISLVLAAPEGQDPLIGLNTFEQGRNFANKLWNAARLVLANQPDEPAMVDLVAEKKNLDPTDRWILSRMTRAIQSITANLDAFRFNAAARGVYDFVRAEYCDWYLEFVKPRFYEEQDPAERARAQAVSRFVLAEIVRLLHPFMPFVTEELWSRMASLHAQGASPHVVVGGWPQADETWLDAKLETAMQQVQDVISAIRTTRSEMKVPPARLAHAVVRTQHKKLEQNLRAYETNIKILGRLEKLSVGPDLEKPVPAASAVIKDAEIFIPLEGVIDLEAERRRLQKEIDRVSEQVARINKKLENQDFLARAPEDVVAKEKAKRHDFEKMLAQLNEHLEKLVGW